MIPVRHLSAITALAVCALAPSGARAQCEHTARYFERAREYGTIYSGALLRERAATQASLANAGRLTPQAAVLTQRLKNLADLIAENRARPNMVAPMICPPALGDMGHLPMMRAEVSRVRGPESFTAELKSQNTQGGWVLSTVIVDGWPTAELRERDAVYLPGVWECCGEATDTPIPVNAYQRRTWKPRWIPIVRQVDWDTLAERRKLANGVESSIAGGTP